VALEYRNIMPHLLAAGTTVVSGIVNGAFAALAASCATGCLTTGFHFPNSYLPGRGPEEAKRKYLVLLQQAGVTNIQLLQAARALNGAPADPDAKRALSAAANAVIESMKNLLLATNALQVSHAHRRFRQEHIGSNSSRSINPS